MTHIKHSIPLLPCIAVSLHNHDSTVPRCCVAAALNILLWRGKQAGDGQGTSEPHFGSHAAAAAVAQLSQWLTTQLTSLSGSSQAQYTPSLKSTVDALQQRLSVSVD